MQWRGADLRQFGKALRQAEKPIRERMYQAMTDAVQPLDEAARQSARSTLPQRGGLAAYVASMRVKVTKKFSGPTASIGLRATLPSGGGRRATTRRRKG